jgi:hypothetical protein
MFPEDEWVKFVRGQFPHYLAFQTGKNQPFERLTALDKNYYLYEIWKHLNSHNCWARVYSEHSIQKQEFDCLPFDFDGHEYPLELAHKEALSFNSHLKDIYNYEPRMYFSGRGVHCYIDFNPIKLDYFKPIARKFYTNIKQIIKSETMDFAIVGDWNRIMRIPYTMNTSAKYYCIPIDPKWDLETIKKKASKTDYSVEQAFNQCNHIRKILIAYDEEEKNKPKEERPKINFEGPKKDRLKLEIEQIYRFAPHTEDHRHRILQFMLVPRLILMGCTDEEVRAECKNYIQTTFGGKSYSDYARYVDDGIRRTRRDKWYPWSFETFIANFPDSAKWFKQK